MPAFRISVEVGRLIPPGSALTSELFPTLSAAVKHIIEAAHRQWRQYASGEPMPNGKVIQIRSGEYARSILIRQLGDFSGEVYTELAYAKYIEDGSPARDLKKMLDTSLKVRVTKDGKKYLIIPFRWNHPGSVMGNSMPKAVWGWWHEPGRVSSEVTGTYWRASGQGVHDVKTRRPAVVPAWTYRWGDKLGEGNLEDLGVGEGHAKRLKGMYMFRKPGGAAGYGQHSKFLTFRTMVEGSPGWLVPAQEGKHPAQQVSEQFQPVAEQAFKAAVERDVRHLLGGS